LSWSASPERERAAWDALQAGSSETPMLAIWPGSGDEPEVIASNFGVWFKELVEGEVADA
jgi:hypothetical protein